MSLWYQTSLENPGVPLASTLPSIGRGGSRPYLQDAKFLRDLDELPVKEIFASVTVLDKDEKPLQSIQGKISDGTINVDGASIVRRTGNLTFLPDEKEGNLTDASNLISINKKIRVEVGYTNALTYQYPEYANIPIIWFPQGIFVINDVSMSQSTTNASITIQMQDKMCLLNGTMAGTFSAAVSLHTVSYTSGANTIEEPVPLYRIIQEVVNHFGEEALHKIIISDIDDEVKQLVKWSGTGPLYRHGNSGAVTLSESNSTNPTKTYLPGDTVGYRMTKLIYPGELTVDAGQTITDVLDKIKNLLGNFEYFYDLEGNFIFREIKNYLNTSHATMVINQMTNERYAKQVNIRKKSVYDFKEGVLINSFSNTPSYANIKNDFVVWGIKTSTTGATYPIRFHLALDKKPIPTEFYIDGGKKRMEDWRNVFWRQGVAALPYGLSSNYYYKELANEWEKIYDPLTHKWLAEIENEEGERVVDDLFSYDYYLDFIDSTEGMHEIGIGNIGRRTKVVTDNDVNCLFPPVIDNLLILKTGESTVSASSRGMIYATVDNGMYDKFEQGTKYKDAFSVIRDLLYQHTNYNTTISMQTIPIYHLDANSRISVYDKKSGTNGDFMLNSFSIPISASGTMSLSAATVLERV